MNTPNKILVLRFSSIGDIVLSSPLLRVLRARFPQSQIDFVTRKEYAELVKSNPNLNYTFEFEATSGFGGLRALKKTIQKEGYDLIVDIHGSLRSRYLRRLSGSPEVVTVNKRLIERAVLVKLKKDIYKDSVSVADRYIESLRPYGLQNDGKGLELHIPDEVQFSAAGKIAKLRLNRFEKTIGLCPSARHETKQWPRERFVELGIRLAKELDSAILVFGGEADRTLGAEVASRIGESVPGDRTTSFCGQLSLLETAAAMDFCDVIVSNDSGLMHIANARQRSLVALIGSTVRQFGFLPQDSNSVVIQRDDLKCRPCSHIGRASCPEGHFRCMRDIAVEEVYSEVKRLLTAKAG